MLTSFCLCLQPRHRYNGDRRLEVNDPIPSSFGSRGLPSSGISAVPTFWSSQEASKTVLTSWQWPRTVSEGQLKKDPWGFYSYFHQNCAHLNKEEWSFLAGDVGRLARLWLHQIGGKKQTRNGDASLSSCSLLFFSCNSENGLNISAIAPGLPRRTLSILLCACLVTKTRPSPGCTSSHE